MELFGLSIGSIGLIEEKMIRKRSDLHLLSNKNVQNLHFSIVFDVQKLHFCIAYVQNRTK